MPLVSIVVPCYNEQSTIGLLLGSIYCQTFPREEMEVIIADGMSTDETRSRIVDFQQAHPQLLVKLVDNPKQIIPAALNCALAQARGEYLIRLDAHSMPQPTYVERCVQDLRAGLGENVGGVWEIHPGDGSWMAASIAAAASHPLGVGDALYRYTTRAGLVDTVPFGAFSRSTLELVGGFDETLLTNEDYEFNTRLRKHGGRIWLNPEIRSVYFARVDLSALSRQYFRYGFWKVRMLLRYPGSVRWRQALPPLFLLTLVILLLLAVWLAPVRWLLAAEIVLYLCILMAGSVRAALRQHKDTRLLFGIPAAIATMHLSWGAGFLWSIVARKS